MCLMWVPFWNINWSPMVFIIREYFDLNVFRTPAAPRTRFDYAKRKHRPLVPFSASTHKTSLGKKNVTIIKHGKTYWYLIIMMINVVPGSLRR